ncbi:hypothetical protein S83_067738, partial [Arachis hypogaea]
NLQQVKWLLILKAPGREFTGIHLLNLMWDRSLSQKQRHMHSTMHMPRVLDSS